MPVSRGSHEIKGNHKLTVDARNTTPRQEKQEENFRTTLRLETTKLIQRHFWQKEKIQRQQHQVILHRKILSS